MRCPLCKSVRGDLVDMAPGRDPDVTPGVKQRSERTARILAKVSSALAFADPSDQGWTQC